MHVCVCVSVLVTFSLYVCTFMCADAHMTCTYDSHETFSLCIDLFSPGAIIHLLVIHSQAHASIHGEAHFHVCAQKIVPLSVPCN